MAPIPVGFKPEIGLQALIPPGRDGLEHLH